MLFWTLMHTCNLHFVLKMFFFHTTMNELAGPKDGENPENICRASPWHEEAIKVVDKQRDSRASVRTKSSWCTEIGKDLKPCLCSGWGGQLNHRQWWIPRYLLFKRNHCCCPYICAVAWHCLDVLPNFYVIVCHTISFPKRFIMAGCTFWAFFVWSTKLSLCMGLMAFISI